MSRTTDETEEMLAGSTKDIKDQEPASLFICSQTKLSSHHQQPYFSGIHYLSLDVLIRNTYTAWSISFDKLAHFCNFIAYSK